MQRKEPLPGKMCALCIPERRFATLFGYMAREYCQSQLVLDTRRRYVAREGRFSRSGPLLGCMKRKTCHGLPPGNTSGRNLATDGHLGTHRARILPRTAAHECTTAKSCRRRTLGSSSQGGFAKRLNAQDGFARRDSRGGSTSKAWPRAKFAMVVLEAGSRGEFARQGLR